MPILCYEVSGITSPNSLSTTGAEDGHLAALIKSDHEEASAQTYAELAANKLAQFLGIPVVAGVPARYAGNDRRIRFAALKAAEHSMNLYDFTKDDEDPNSYIDEPLMDGMHINTGHVLALQKVCIKYPIETAQIAVFDLWIGNEDRPLNFKAELQDSGRGIFFALDQGSSLISCASPVERALSLLEKDSYPSFHVFQKLVHPVYCGSMIERIMNMPDWAILAATTFDDTVGNVTLDEQYATYDALLKRRGFLQDIVTRLLL